MPPYNLRKGEATQGLHEVPHTRRLTVGWLAGGLTALLLLFLSLNAFNLSFLLPRSSAQLFVFTGLSVLVFLLLLLVLVLLFRNIVKLYADEQSRVLGSRIRTRMLLGALLLSFAPAIFLFLFSYLLMNRTVDRWFSQPAAQVRDESSRIALQLTQYAISNARAEAASLAAAPRMHEELIRGNPAALEKRLAERRITLEGGFVLIYKGNAVKLSFHLPDGGKVSSLHTWNGEDEPVGANHDLDAIALETSRKSDQPLITIADTEYVLASAPVAGDFTIVCGMPMPDGFSRNVYRLRRGAEDYWTLHRARNRIRGLYLLIISLLTVLVFFTSSWLALFLSKRITRPVEALADAMDAIAAGQYSHRIAVNWCVPSMPWLPIWRPRASWWSPLPGNSPLRTRLCRNGAENLRPFSRPFLPE